MSGRLLRSGFTLVELLVVIGIIVVLIALLLPAIGMVRDRGRNAQCQSNLAEIGIALGQANSKQPQPVRSPEWTDRLAPFVEDATRLFLCPADFGTTDVTSYGMNHRAHRMLSGDSTKIVMLDYAADEARLVVTTLDRQDDWDSMAPTNRHRGSLNTLQYGGSVAAEDPFLIDPRRCKPFFEHWRPMRDHDIALADCDPSDDSTTGTIDGTSDGTTGGTTDGTTGGGGPGPDDPPCNDPDSGFPEIWDFWIVTEVSCGNFHSQYTLDPNSSNYVLLVDDTSDSYSLIYSDQDYGPSTVGDDMELYVTRESDGSIRIEPIWHSSAGVYTIYDGDPDNGGQPVSGLTRLGGNGTFPPEGCGCDQHSAVAQYSGCPTFIENVVPSPTSVGIIPGVLCNP